MSKGFRLNITCGNAAFDEGHSQHEIARILRKIADDIVEDGDECYMHIIRDVNGNTVGGYSYTKEK